MTERTSKILKQKIICVVFNPIIGRKLNIHSNKDIHTGMSRRVEEEKTKGVPTFYCILMIHIIKILKAYTFPFIIKSDQELKSI